MVDLKSKFWLYLIIDALIVIIAIITPAITANYSSGIALLWMWSSYIAPPTEVVLIPDIIFLTGIIFLMLNIIGIIILLYTGLASRKGVENKKILMILLLICGIILIMGSIIYLTVMGNAVGVSWGFFNPNFGSIGPIIAGVLAFVGIFISRKI
ncbi:MAG: hypothetical protein ACFE8J_19280 [Candidatus Heimdallarchaeota archaeon]